MDTNFISTIIVDDEPLARILLEGLLKKHCPQVRIEAVCSDLPSAVKAIHKHHPHLVFLDIEMPNFSGLEILDFFNEEDINFSIIFTTAYDQYAIKAFKLSAVDYLLKPIDHKMLEESVARFAKKQQQEKTGLELRLLRENMQNQQASKLAVPFGNAVRFLELDAVVFIHAEGNYSDIFMSDGSKLLVSRTLKNFEDAFANNPLFFRNHKSYIINLAYVTEYTKSNNATLTLQNKYTVPISPEKVQDFLDSSVYIKR